MRADIKHSGRNIYGSSTIQTSRIKGSLDGSAIIGRCVCYSTVIHDIIEIILCRAWYGCIGVEGDFLLIQVQGFLRNQDFTIALIIYVHFNREAIIQNLRICNSRLQAQVEFIQIKGVTQQGY